MSNHKEAAKSFLQMAGMGKVTRQDQDAPAVAVVHIFRFEQDHVVELWDLGQEISRDSPNENGML